MRPQHLADMRKERDPCPVCGLEITLDVVEPHPVDEQLEIQGYICKKCGPVKSVVVLRSLPLHLVM
jgi:C4-type Zn-finger protein